MYSDVNTSVFAGLIGAGAKRPDESWSSYWNRVKASLDGDFGMRAAARKAKCRVGEWHDTLTLSLLAAQDSMVEVAMIDAVTVANDYE